MKSAGFIHATVLIAALTWIHGVSLAYATLCGLGTTFFKVTVPAFAICGVVIYILRNNHAAVRCIVGLSYLLVCGHVMGISSAAAFYRNPSQFKTLPDVGFDLIPVITHVKLPFGIYITGQEIPDILFPVLLISSITFVLLRKNSLILLTRIGVIWGTLMFFRTITVITTSVPDPSLICQEITKGTVEMSKLPYVLIMKRALMVVLPGSGGTITCGDMLFSGHTVELVICGMIWHTYFPIRNKYCNLVKCTIWIIISILLYILIGVRMHYTIDVLLGIYMTITLWNSYHRVGRDVQMGMKFSTMWLIDGFIYPFVQWLEMYENDMLESKLNISDLHTDNFVKLGLLSSLSINEVKDLVSRLDKYNLLKLQKEVKLCKENYLNEIYKLCKSEEMLLNINEQIEEISKSILINEQEIKDEEYKNKMTIELYENKLKEDEKLKNEMMKLLNDGKVEESLKCLNKKMNNSEGKDEKYNSNNDENGNKLKENDDDNNINQLLNKIEILENEIKYFKQNKSELLLKQSKTK